MKLQRNIENASWTLEKWDQPAGETGGDFVVFRRDNNTLRVLVGDATGHGEEAAALATAARGVIEAEFDGPITLETLKRWSEAIYNMNTDKFVCCTYIEIDLTTRQARVANAGNPSVLVVRGRTGQIQEFRSTGMPLGLVESEIWRSPKMLQFTLDTEDTIVCFTDGLTDAIDPRREQFGLQRVISTVRSTQDSPIETLGRCVTEFADFFAEQDDLTVLSIRNAAKDAA